mmetsp:Transcript_42886/g.97814  ORF Transcript_42886/g.97814 Transcript_42886/m.97814 type:complete len:373 (-) Transcript_42886:46-1164(-)
MQVAPQQWVDPASARPLLVMSPGQGPPGQQQQMVARSAPEQDSDEDSDDDNHTQETQQLCENEDIYDVFIGCLLYDLARYHMGKSRGGGCRRFFRTAAVFFVMLLNMAAQIYIIYNVKRFVSSWAVGEARGSYSQYEEHMYTSTHLNNHGMHRGNSGAFHPENFETLTADQKKVMCQIALSQPAFLLVMLGVWTLGNFGEVKLTFQQAYNVLSLETSGRGLSATAEETDDGIKITKVSMGVKILTMICVTIPRLVVTLVLLWLGCRWLTATESFADIILNALALTFLIDLNCLLYRTVMPKRDLVDAQKTCVVKDEELAPSLLNYTADLIWLLLAVFWVWLYVFHIQAVLTEYKYDVGGVCTPFLDSLASVR